MLLALPFFRSAGGVLPAGALLFALSVLGAFESPVVQACLPQLLSGERLLRGNSVVNQIQALAGLVTPFLGGLAYAGLGLGPVLLAAGLCFLLTAGLECFIRLPAPGPRGGGGLLSGLGRDLRESLRFLRREEPGLLRLLLLAAGASFFVSGTAAVGFPHLVRNVLGLSAELYGASESVLGAAAVLGAVQGGVTLKGLSADTLQGDAAILDILRRCGASFRTTDAGIVFEKAPLHGVDIDLADCPDLGPVLMVLGLLCEGTTTIRNAERLRIKESDRIAAMEAELRACGGVLESEGGTITIHGCADRLHAPAAPLHGHNDHRVVMSLAVLALAAGLELSIDDAEAVQKSWPHFFEAIKPLGAEVEYAG